MRAGALTTSKEDHVPFIIGFLVCGCAGVCASFVFVAPLRSLAIPISSSGTVRSISKLNTITDVECASARVCVCWCAGRDRRWWRVRCRNGATIFSSFLREHVDSIYTPNHHHRPSRTVRLNANEDNNNSHKSSGRCAVTSRHCDNIVVCVRACVRTSY